MSDKIGQRTIEDFGRQHQTYSESGGYYVSTDILGDVVGPLMDVSEFKDRDILDLGSGTGRWLRVFHQLGAKSITAVEPSPAIDVSRENTADLDRITYHQVTGDKLPDGPYDYIHSYGVIHHIPEPDPVMRRAYDVLRPGGRIIIWLYGRENNGLYLALMHLMRLFTVPMRHRGLDILSAAMVPMVRAYSRLGKIVPLPLRGYMESFIDRVDDYTVQHVIYDQLDPHYAKYYRRREAIGLVERAGFESVDAYHRENYSWTVIGTKPDA